MKNKTVYICQKCGFKAPKWMGKCSDCHEWNTFIEEIAVSKIKNSQDSYSDNKPLKISQVQSVEKPRTLTHIKEFDRVVGGGIVPESLILVGGEPGIGKSTLMLEVIGSLALRYPDMKIMYISGEESYGQLAQRAKRLNIVDGNFYLFNEVNWGVIKPMLDKEQPDILIVDSIQTIYSPDLQSTAGSVAQIKEITFELLNYTKGHGITTFLIGHVNKDGDLAGPKILEHMVDTVLYFEGERDGHFRILRAIKNRFGNIHEIGIFEMTGQGLKSVENPSQIFMDNPLKESFGRSLSITQEGSRGLIIEIQALVIENKFGNGKRVTQGMNLNRLNMLIAIIEKYFEIPLYYYDVYLNVVGGIQLHSREADLAAIASILSSLRSTPIKGNPVFIGELGLTGEVRHTNLLDVKLNEITQLGKFKIFTTGPKKILEKFRCQNNEIIDVKSVKELESEIF